MKRRKLGWTDRAEADLVDIGDFIARDDPVAARKWVRALMAAARAAAKVPYGGRRVPEYQREEIREVFLERYRIAYRVTLKHCAVLTVFEGHRRLRP